MSSQMQRLCPLCLPVKVCAFLCGPLARRSNPLFSPTDVYANAGRVSSVALWLQLQGSSNILLYIELMSLILFSEIEIATVSKTQNV